MTAVHSIGAGADGYLGTRDDDATTPATGGIPAVELLIPDTFAPETGDMLRIDVSPAPVGRLLAFTIRLNARGADGKFLLPNDFVLSGRVALRR